MDRHIIKSVSLDSETVRIAKTIPNLSSWVRTQLRQREQGNDVATELELRLKWVKMAKMMAEYIAGQENDYESANDVENDFRLLIETQTSLTDF